MTIIKNGIEKYIWKSNTYICMPKLYLQCFRDFCFDNACLKTKTNMLGIHYPLFNTILLHSRLTVEILHMLKPFLKFVLLNPAMEPRQGVTRVLLALCLTEPCKANSRVGDLNARALRSNEREERAGSQVADEVVTFLLECLPCLQVHTSEHKWTRSSWTLAHKLTIATLWGYPFVLFIIKLLPHHQYLPPQWRRNKGHICVVLFKYSHKVSLASPHTQNLLPKEQCCVRVQIVKSESESSPLSPSHHLQVWVRVITSKSESESSPQSMSPSQKKIQVCVTSPVGHIFDISLSSKIWKQTKYISLPHLFQ